MHCDGNRFVTAFSADTSVSNEICTSKYTILTFIPLNLFEQFHNLANVYFLIIAVLQCLPQITITGGKPFILAPLSFVLTVAAIKDAVEDRKRHEADNAENENKATVVDATGKETSVQWRELCPGQIIKLSKLDKVPADAVLLLSADPTGAAAVETAELDGETNLKPKVAILTGSSLPSKTECKFEAPNTKLYDFQGSINADGVESPLCADNLLLRGCIFHRTEWAYALVVYGGHETRVMMNSKKGAFKQSLLDVQMNKLIIVIFIFELVLCCGGGLMYALWEWSNGEGSWYIMTKPNNRGVLLKVGGTWLLQLNNLVPISLIVTMTTVKYLQGVFIAWDERIRDVKSTKPTEVHSSSVLETLGRVTHVFSDKTGTLTCNEMTFKACSVAGRIYGLGQGKPEARRRSSVCGAAISSVDFDGTMMMQDIKKGEGAEKLVDFLLVLALNQTVVPSGTDDTNLEYEASSPDELALVGMARAMGLVFVQRTQSKIQLHVIKKDLEAQLTAVTGGVQDGVLTVDLLDVCEFDNDRKRMSVIVRYPNGKNVLLVKGADSSVLSCIPENTEVQKCQGHLHEFANLGLRTLCLAKRDLTDQYYEAFHKKLDEAQKMISASKPQILHDLAVELETEKGLQLVGATAIEDRLQDGVPEVIETLRQAGICVWVLTGDKVETAISIGFSCHLLTKDMINTVVSEEMDEAVIKKTFDGLSDGQAKTAEDAIQFGEPLKAITVTGAALERILADDVLTKAFNNGARRCRTVICCRVSPKQKADVVKMVQDHEKGAIALAIGDGANDVAMITTAHVGIGLSGREGAQAARCADFACAQFKFMRRLLFVHGREGYRRNATLVLYNFYKNLSLVLFPVFSAAFSGNFSGQPAYDQKLYQLYNMIFTSVPIVLYAILDRAAPDISYLERTPQAYVPSRKGTYFSYKIFVRWMVCGAVQTLFTTAYVQMAIGESSTCGGGRPSSDHWMEGQLVYFLVVFLVNITLMLRLSAWMTAILVAIFISIISYPIALVAVESSRLSVELIGVTERIFGGCSSTPFVMILALFTHLLLDQLFLPKTKHNFWSNPKREQPNYGAALLP